MYVGSKAFRDRRKLTRATIPTLFSSYYSDNLSSTLAGPSRSAWYEQQLWRVYTAQMGEQGKIKDKQTRMHL